MRLARERIVLTLVADGEDKERLLWYSDVVARERGARTHVVEGGARGAAGSGAESMRQIASQAPVEAVVSGWSSDEGELQGVLRAIVDTGATGIVVRPSEAQNMKRVLVPTGGGPHAPQQFWAARSLALALDAPTKLVRVVSPGPGGRGHASAPGAWLTSWQAAASAQARAVGVRGPVEVVAGADAVSGIMRYAQPEDLVVMGAPHYWRVATRFEGSVPDLVAKRIPNGLVMLVGKRRPRLSLRDVMWEDTVAVNLRPESSEQAIASLVGILAAQHQIPVDMTEYALNRALARERIMPTTVGYETAFPHATLPDFAGVLVAMAVCPQGVKFSPTAAPVRFVFLLVTPTNFYDEYLATLARISQRMVLPRVREELLLCRDAQEVLKVLEPTEP